MKTTINQRGEYGRGCAPNILCIISRHYLWLLCSLCTHGSPTRLCRDPDNQITPEHASPLVPTPSKISITASVFRSSLQLSQVCHRDEISGVLERFFVFYFENRKSCRNKFIWRENKVQFHIYECKSLLLGLVDYETIVRLNKRFHFHLHFSWFLLVYSNH